QHFIENIPGMQCLYIDLENHCPQPIFVLMEISVRNLFLSILFIFFWNHSSFTQCSNSSECGPGYICCGGSCKQAGTCAPGNPPPPGLVVPIDSHISFLLFSGLGLGVFFYFSQRKKESA